MSRYPGANWRGPVPNMAPGGMASHRLFVLHIQEGTEAGTDAWVHNPAARVSANFGNPRVGRPDQWVDTDDRAWAQAAYNGVAISVENEGNSGDPLNANQLENAAQILAWVHRVHGTPLQITDDPNGSGVIGHSLLGVAGGNHPDCPGQPILNQRQAIVDRARQIVGGTAVSVLVDEDLDNVAARVENRPVGRIPATAPATSTSLGVEVASNPGRWSILMAGISAISSTLSAILSKVNTLSSPPAMDASAVAAALASDEVFIQAVASATAHQVLVGLRNDLPST